MPISKDEVRWKDYNKKELLYRGFILELLMDNPDQAYTYSELCAHIIGRLGDEVVKQDNTFEGNVRAGLMDPRIAIALHKGQTYYSIKENPQTR